MSMAHRLGLLLLSRPSCRRRPSPSCRQPWRRPSCVFLALVLVPVFVLVLRIVLVLRLVVPFDVVAGGERRGDVAAQGHRDDARRVRIRPAVVEVAVDRLEGAVREEVEVLALGIEHGRGVGEVAGRRLVLLRGCRVVEEDGRVCRLLDGARPGQPARVRRPAQRQGLEALVGHPDRHLIDLGQLAAGDVEQAQRLGLIDEREPGAVRRPLHGIAVARAERRDGLLRSGAVGRPQHQLVLAGAIAPIGHGLAVGRPARIALRRSRRARQVEHRAELGRHREDVAARPEHGALAGGGGRGVADQVGDRLAARLERGLVGDDLDAHFARFLGRQIQQVEAAARLEHDVLRAERREGHVEVGELRHLAERSVLVAGPDVGALVGAAIGQEVERVAVPHRMLVVGVARGHVGRGPGRQVERPDVRRPAAAVSLPGAERLRLRQVGELRAVGGVGGELAVGHRQLLGRSALGGHQVELVVALAAALARGREQDARAIRVPVEHAVGHRMPGQARRLAALHRHRVDVGVAVVVGGVGERLAVRREARERLLAAGRAEAHGDAALLRRQPDVAGVDEGDLRRRHVGLPQHARVDLRGRRRGRDQGTGQGGQNQAGQQSHRSLLEK